MHYDYLIVGAGLFGAVFAHEMTKEGKKCLVVEKRDHIAGNIYCETVDDIHVHKYGAHIFHTSNKKSMGLYQHIWRSLIIILILRSHHIRMSFTIFRLI